MKTGVKNKKKMERLELIIGGYMGEGTLDSYCDYSNFHYCHITVCGSQNYCGSRSTRRLGPIRTPLWST